MRKFLVFTIPIISMAIFVLIMLSGDFLKRPLGKDDNIPEVIQTITNNIKDGKWGEASNNAEKLSATWNKVIKRVQFSSERDEINAFTMNVARLRGSLMAENKANSLSELSEAYEHWKDLGK